MDLKPLVKELEKTPVTDQVIYEPSVKELEMTKTFVDLQENIYVKMDIEYIALNLMK